ncbi:MAG TPA: DNA repair protein RadA, partial [Bacillota bacterium]|nr:DNA repair protein RadA [Bacillota bacterium]
ASLRSVPKAEARAAEAARLGFVNLVVPKANLTRMKASRQLSEQAEVFGAGTLAEALEYLLG